MKLKDLINFDSSTKMIQMSSSSEDLFGVSNVENLSKNSVVFLKNQKFLEKFLPHLPTALSLNVGAIIDEKFFHGIREEIKLLLNQLPWVATSSNLPLSLAQISKYFFDKKMDGINSQVDGRQMGTTDIHPGSFVAQNVFIGEYVKIAANVEIMPGSVILSHSEIGENTKIYPNVTIYPFTKIGKNCRIHSGSVIGSDGFGYTFYQGQHVKIWHTGGVILEDDVEIGANSSVDMGTFSPTIIGSGTRIDNLVQIAHNVKLGRGCIICGQAGIAGSAVLEDFVVLGGRAAVGPDAHIGKGSQVAGGALVNEGAIWPAGSQLGGHPAKDLKEWMRGVAYLRKVSLNHKSKD